MAQYSLRETKQEGKEDKNGLRIANRQGAKIAKRKRKMEE